MIRILFDAILALRFFPLAVSKVRGGQRRLGTRFPA